MDKEEIRVKSPFNYIDMPFWNEFQENLSSLLDVSIGVYDAKGFVVHPPNREDCLYGALKNIGKYRDLYQESYMRAINKAIERNETYIYKCFTNQYIYAIPVPFEGSEPLAIVGGHVYLSEDDYHEFIEARHPELNGMQGIEKSLKIVPPHSFFEKPQLIKNLAVSFLKSLYQKGFYEKEYFQLKTLIQATVPSDIIMDKADVYKNVFNTLLVLFDIDSIAIMEKDEKDIYKCNAAFGHKSDAISKWTVPISSELIKGVRNSKKSGRYSNPLNIRKLGLSKDIRNVYILPMVIWDDVFGLLCIFNTDISKRNIKLITHLVNQLSIVVEGMRREQLMKRRIKRLDALEGVYKTIAPVLNQEELYDAILDKSMELVDAEQGSLMMLNISNKTLCVKTTRGIDKSILEGLKFRVGDGISGTVVEKGNPVLVKDIENELFGRKNRPRYKTRSFLSIPLKIDSRIIGVVNISDKITGEAFSEDDLELLFSFTSYATVALERGAYYRLTEQLKQISITDSLTGLINRRYFGERLSEEVQRSKRYEEPFTLFMVDLDDFKSMNDKYGHLAGDEALKKVAYAIRDGVRSIDVVARFGGEEFMVILPNTKEVDSLAIAERIRKGVEISRFMSSKIPAEETLTVSIGIAEYPTNADSIDELIDKADRAMYMAKARGKNKIVEYSITA